MNLSSPACAPHTPQPLRPPHSQKHEGTETISHLPGGRTAQLRSPHGFPGTPATLLLTGCLMITCMAAFQSASQDIRHSGVTDKDRKNSNRYQRLWVPIISIWSSTAESWGHTHAPLLSDTASSPALCRRHPILRPCGEVPSQARTHSSLPGFSRC